MMIRPLFVCSAVRCLCSYCKVMTSYFVVIPITIKELRILQAQGPAGYLNDELVNALLGIFVQVYGGRGDHAITSFLFKCLEKGNQLRELKKRLTQVFCNCISDVF